MITRSPTPLIRIEITPTMSAVVSAWCARFVAADLCWWQEPKVEGNFLVINSFDIPNFLRTANKPESSQMDVHRLKKAAIMSIDQAAKRARSTPTLRALHDAREWTLQAPLGEWDGKPVREEHQAHPPGFRFTPVALHLQS